MVYYKGMKTIRALIVVTVVAIMSAVLIVLLKQGALSQVSFPFASDVREAATGGTVTRKFTNCEGGMQLDKLTGVVRDIPISEVTCDLGSTVTINYVDEIITATGKVSPGTAFSVDVTQINVGDTVLVRYRLDDNGEKNLNCEICGIEKV